MKIFNGLKDSNQVFDRLEILHNNVNVGYQQNEMIREGFLYGFKATNSANFEYDINIPFDDLLALQAFDLFPNGLIGDISIKFKVSGAGQVWAFIEPHEVATVKSTIEQDPLVTGELLAATQQMFLN